MTPDIQLNGDYIRGYTAALMDVREEIASVVQELKHQKVRLTAKELDKLLECMIKHRAILREYPDAFVRRNNTTGEYEIYITGEGVYSPRKETP